MKSSIKLIIVSVMAFIGIGGYYYMFAKIRDANVSASERSQAYERQLLLQDETRSLSNLLSGVGESKEELNAYFLKDEEDIISFLEGDTNSIRQIQDSVGSVITVTSIDESDHEKSDFIENVDVGLSIEGTWDQVYQTIELIESLPYQLDVSHVQVSGRGISKPSSRVSEATSEAPADKVAEKVKATPLPEWTGSIRFSIKKLK